MTKMRFTDCDKWRDPWFMDLSADMKLLWLYICDCCDNSGVWEVNARLAEFQLGQRIDWVLALNLFEGRIVNLTGSKWHLVKFLAFQYPGGLGDSNAHVQVKRTLAAHGIEYTTKDRGGGEPVMASGSHQDKDKDHSPSDWKGGPGGKPPTAAENRERLVKFAKAKRVSASADSIEELIGLARDSGCKGIEDTLDMLDWAINQARKVREVRYARHFETEAATWAKMKTETERISKGHA